MQCQTPELYRILWLSRTSFAHSIRERQRGGLHPGWA